MDPSARPASTPPASPGCAPQSRGFTLIELMVTVAIIAILTAFGVPSVRAHLEDSAVSGQVNSFMGSFNLARSEAIKRFGTVIMCRSAQAQAAATEGCAGRGGWDAGWIVFLDRDGDRDYTCGPDPDNCPSGDVLIRVQGPLANSGGIAGSGAVSFHQTGIISSGVATLRFQSASQASELQRCVMISSAGRARITSGSDCA